MRVLDMLEGLLPTHVRFHLFGIRIPLPFLNLKIRPRVASVDSMAWSSTARWEALKKKQPKGKAFLAGKMEASGNDSEATHQSEPTTQSFVTLGSSSPSRLVYPSAHAFLIPFEAGPLLR